MLKTLGRFTPSFSSHHGAKSNTSMLRVLNSFRDSKQSSHNFYRRSFCSDSSVTEPVVESKEIIDEWLTELKQARSKISTVLALPLLDKPLFQDAYMRVFVKDTKLLEALEETYKHKKPLAPPLVGAFLVKENGPNTEENIYELKGKYMRNRLYEVGRLAQIASIQGDKVLIMGCDRIRITETVEEEPLRVKIDHLKDNFYNTDDDLIKAKSLEVISTIIDLMNAKSLSRDLVQNSKKHLNEISYANLADFGAGASQANKFQCQQFIEEMDLYKRLQLTLDIVKKDLEDTKIQVSSLKKCNEEQGEDNHISSN